MKLQGKLFLIVGPSGTGKSTLARSLSQNHGIPEVVSHTTRAPRLGEVDGVNYHFITREWFIQMRERGEFIEHVEYNGNLYGSARSAVLGLLEKGDATIVVEGHGAEQFKKALPDLTEIIFLLPPRDEELRRRLALRGDSPESIETRMRSKVNEMSYHFKFDRAGLLPWGNEIYAKTVNDLVLQALRVIEEPRGVVRDHFGRVVEPGQRAAFVYDNSMLAGAVVRVQAAKKVLTHRYPPTIVVRLDEQYSTRHPERELQVKGERLVVL